MTFSTVIADTRKAVTDDTRHRPSALQRARDTDRCHRWMCVTPPSFTVDEPPRTRGGGSAPNPVEYALASLGSCQAITFRFWAEHLGISVRQAHRHS